MKRGSSVTEGIGGRTRGGEATVHRTMTVEHSWEVKKGISEEELAIG